MSENQRQIQVLAVIPSLSKPTEETSASLISYYRNCKYPVQIRYIFDTYLHTARNIAVTMAIETKATHLMFIDSDMAFPNYGVDRLVERGEYIIGGLYFGRMKPLPVALERHPDNTLKSMRKIPTWDEPFEADAVGTGFMLIDMKVFQKMEPPFFTYTKPENFGYKASVFPRDDVGEDVYFCLKARQNGFRIMVDPTIPLGHVGKRIYTKKDWEIYQREDMKEFYDHPKIY